MVWRINFRLIGIAHAVVYPVNTETWDTWIAYITWFQHAFPHIQPDISTWDYSDIELFKERGVRHENNHLHPFKEAKEFIVSKLTDVENNGVFSSDVAARQAANNASSKARAVWQSAGTHAASYDTEPRRTRSFYDYPAAPVFNPTW